MLDGSRDLATVPTLIKRIIADEMWREWADPASGRSYGPFRTFEHFVITPVRNGGLGSSIKQVLALCVDDADAVNAIDAATQRNSGRPKIDNNVQDKAPVGNANRAALRRLRKDRPDLHAEVLAERISAHGAMVQAGFRPRTIPVPITRPDAIAAALKRNMSAEDFTMLVKILTAGDR